MPDIAGWLQEDRGTSLAFAGKAVQTQVPHAPAMSGSFPCKRADAGGEPYRHSPRCKIVTERADRWLVFEQKSWHMDAMPVDVIRHTCNMPVTGSRRGPSGVTVYYGPGKIVTPP